MNVLIAEDHALFRDALKNLVIQIAPNLHILETSKYAYTLSTIENKLSNLFLFNVIEESYR